jgi:hypothetical protein
VNAGFAIRSSRKGLYESTADDRHKFPIQMQWNQVLMQDAVLNAYIQLLNDLDKLIPDNIDIPLFTIWPAVHGENPLFQPLIHSFFQYVSTTNQAVNISFQDKKFVPFSKAVFLDPSLYKSKLEWQGSTPVAATVAVFSQLNRNEVIVNVNDNVMKGFKLSGCHEILHKKTYAVHRLFGDVIMRNISALEAVPRDVLIAFALLSDDERLDKLLCSQPCIAVTPDGTGLRKPSEVIFAHAVAARMFLPEDGRFPFGIMATRDLLKVSSYTLNLYHI